MLPAIDARAPVRSHSAFQGDVIRIAGASVCAAAPVAAGSLVDHRYTPLHTIKSQPPTPRESQRPSLGKRQRPTHDMITHMGLYDNTFSCRLEHFTLACRPRGRSPRPTAGRRPATRRPRPAEAGLWRAADFVRRRRSPSTMQDIACFDLLALARPRSA